MPDISGTATIYALQGADRKWNSAQSSFGILAAAKNVNYGRAEIPSERDVQIRELLLQVADRMPFDELGSRIPRDASRVLSVFAERAASIAVRHQNARELRAGLLAAAVAAMLDDEAREVIPALSPLYRAAEMIGHNPDSEFAAVNELCGGKATLLLKFSQRAPADKSIEAMGYEEGDEKRGFRFVRNW